MLVDLKLCIIGAGNMGEALISGLVSSGAAKPENIVCTDIQSQKLNRITETYGVMNTTDSIEGIKSADVVIYAVKPQVLARVLKDTACGLDMSKLIISVAAGVPLAAIEAVLNKDLRLIRTMPNVAVAVRAGATAIAAGRHALESDLEVAREIFNSVGETVFVEEKNLMDAVTGLSGSGPAYVFIMVEALADAGVKMGLTRQDALFLATQTLLGAATLLKETGKHPGILKDTVTSPAGTTIAGLHKLEQGGLRNTLINAVEAAALRSRELGTQVVEVFKKMG